MTRHWTLAICICSFAALDRAEPLQADPHSIENALASFQAADGLVVNLFASEADGIVNPINMRWDARGRLWVACSTVYPQLEPGQTPNDQIVVLEDLDEDGRADKSTVFADDLNIPTGLELGGGGLYVGQGRELLLLRDTDNDGRADERQILLSGFGKGDSHQTINSFVWSPGGELYFSQGDGNYSYVETPWGRRSLRQSGMWRLRPRRLELDTLLNDFMGPGNPWGTVFDDWGQPIIVDGAGGITYLTPGLIPTSHYLKLERIGPPGGYGGLDALSGRHLPQEYHGDFAIADYHPNRVSRFALRPNGAGYAVDFKAPVLVSSDRNFRPVDVRVGPDGAIYVADWYNPVICHQEVSYRDPQRDRTHGRIWRVSAQERALVKKPQLVGTSLEHLLDALKAPERWTRYQVKRLLADRFLVDGDSTHVASALKRWVAELDPGDPDHERLLFEALGVYESLEIVEPVLLGRVLEAKDHRARAYATRVIGRWQDRLEKPLTLLQKQVADPHPQVRLEAVLSTALVPAPEAVEVASRVVDQPTDRFIEYALTQAVHHLKPHWLPAFVKKKLTFSGKVERLAAVVKTVRSTELIPGLRDLVTAPELDDETRLAMLRTLADVGTPDDLRFLFEAKTYTRGSQYDTSLHATMLSELEAAHQERKVRPSGDLTEPLRWLLRQGDGERTQQAIRLAAVWNMPSLTEDVLGLARNRRLGLEARRAAVETLVALGGSDAHTVLEELAGREKLLPLRTAATVALCHFDAQAAAEYAAESLSGPEAQDVDLTELLMAFLTRQDGAGALAKALGEVTLAADTAERCSQVLSSAGRTDQPLVRAINEAMGVGHGVPEYSAEFVERLVAEAREKGDAARGELVFRSRKANCYSCHKIGVAGGWVGPDLSGIGTTLSLERIAEEVLWPSRQVKEGFSLLQVVTASGAIYQGYEERERERGDSSDDLLLDDLVTGDEIRIPQREVVARTMGGTAMPSGLAQGLSHAQVRDLLRFLSQLGAPGPFTVSKRPVIRRWEVLRRLPEELLTHPAQTQHYVSEGFFDLPWELVYSRVSGLLELSDIFPPGIRERVAIVRTEVEVDRGGPFRLELNDTKGLRVWWDDRRIEISKDSILELEQGDHHLTFMIDRTARAVLGLFAEWRAVDGSPAVIDFD